MTDAPAKKPDLTKGTQYRALQNISFGSLRPSVKAGELFNLDDPAVAKELLTKKVITTDLKAPMPTDRSAADINQGEAPNAAKVRGDAADDAAAAAAGKPAPAGGFADGPGQTTGAGNKSS
jgi:hypothetical protein